MTPFDSWVLETAAAMVKPTEEDYNAGLDAIQYAEDGPPEIDWDALRLRFAIALVQARALECRQISGSLLVKQPGSLKQIADGLTDRSHKLEALGLRMAAGKWPEEEDSEGLRLVQ
jgi:hypothetical protein